MYVYSITVKSSNIMNFTMGVFTSVAADNIHAWYLANIIISVHIITAYKTVQYTIMATVDN